MVAHDERDVSPQGAVTFLPHRLNRQPVVVRGLAADELWVCGGLSAVCGFAAGLPLAWLTHTIAMVPSVIVAAIALGIFGGGGVLRRHKRGRPDTWLYRQLQWRLAILAPSIAVHAGGRGLVTRSGRWSVRRTGAFAARGGAS